MSHKLILSLHQGCLTEEALPVIKLCLDVLPISSNHTKIPLIVKGRACMVPSAAFKKQKAELLKEVSLRYESMLRTFFQDYSELTHEVAVSFKFFFPNMYTKDGRINQHVPDCTNLIKTLEDVVFEVAGHKDHVVTTSTTKKRLGNGPRVEMLMALVSREEVCDYES